MNTRVVNEVCMYTHTNDFLHWGRTAELGETGALPVTRAKDSEFVLCNICLQK